MCNTSFIGFEWIPWAQLPGGATHGFSENAINYIIIQVIASASARTCQRKCHGNGAKKRILNMAVSRSTKLSAVSTKHSNMQRAEIFCDFKLC